MLFLAAVKGPSSSCFPQSPHLATFAVKHKRSERALCFPRKPLGKGSPHALTTKTMRHGTGRKGHCAFLGSWAGSLRKRRAISSLPHLATKATRCKTGLKGHQAFIGCQKAFHPVLGLLTFVERCGREEIALPLATGSRRHMRGGGGMPRVPIRLPIWTHQHFLQWIYLKKYF